jgi:hypothetical protein
MPGRIYSVSFSAVAVTAQQDFFEVNAASTKVVELLEFGLSQLTEVADAAEEMLLVLVKTGAATSGSGGTAPTAIPRQLGDAAFAGTVEVNNTTKATTGTIVTHEVYHMNVRVPFQKIWTPETTIILAPSGRLHIELATTPADSITMGGYAVFREMG